MPTTILQQNGFKEIYSNTYASLWISQDQGTAVMIAKAEYIPIDRFKQLFNFISDEVNPVPQKLVFDKSALRTFHQPSMEWYFAIWKPLMKTKGLTHHYKILPELPWFEKAVEAGRHEIFRKYDTTILEGINIKYVASLGEVIGN